MWVICLINYCLLRFTKAWFLPMRRKWARRWCSSLVQSVAVMRQMQTCQPKLNIYRRSSTTTTTAAAAFYIYDEMRWWNLFLSFSLWTKQNNFDGHFTGIVNVCCVWKLLGLAVGLLHSHRWGFAALCLSKCWAWKADILQILFQEGIF